jgi:hypothetical protein
MADGVTSNIDTVIVNLQKIANNSAVLDVSAALTQGVNEARVAMIFRIFNKGLDAEGTTLGKYVGKKFGVSSRRFKGGSEPVGDSTVKKKLKEEEKKFKKSAEKTGQTEFTEYEKKRLAAGRQISYKDLEFHGSLRRAIITAVNDFRTVSCVINNTEEAKIATYQEEQIGRIRGSGADAKIFTLSTDERDILKQKTIIALQQLYVSLFGT